MGREDQPSEDIDPDCPPPLRGRDQHRHRGIVGRPIDGEGALDPLVRGEVEEIVEVLLFPGHEPGGVDHVEAHVEEVGGHIDVGLRTPAAGGVAEALVLKNEKDF